jgi:hypothetical protein
MTILFEVIQTSIRSCSWIISPRNYIPLGYKREEPEDYYNIVYDHATWMEKTRNLIITNVPTYSHYTDVTNTANNTLKTLRQQTTGVENASYIQNKEQVNITIQADKLNRVTKAIQENLSNDGFAYRPQIAKKFNPTGSLGTNKSGTSKYSAAMSKYKTTRSNASVATSYGDSSRKTGYTGI